MKKVIALGLLISSLTACSSLPTDMNKLGENVTKGAKGFGNYLLEIDKQAREGNLATTTTKSSTQKGLISLEDCQQSEGKTKAQIEKIIGIELNVKNAYTINSFSAVYNIAVKDMKSQFGSTVPVICSVSFEGTKPTSKVLVWSLIGN